MEPLSRVGPVITIRKFSARPFMVEDLIGFGTATPDMFEFLKACIEAKLNLFVSGGTRPDRGRGGPVGGGAGHAPGDDDRPRRLALDRSREQPQGHAPPARDDGP